MNIIIRNANKNDMKDIAAINLKCVPEGTRAKWGLKLTAEFFSFFWEEDHLFLVADVEGKIVAYIMGYWRGSTARGNFETKHAEVLKSKTPVSPDQFDKTTIKKNKETEFNKNIEKKYSAVLYSLCVLPEYCRKGLGKALVKKFSDEVLTFGGKNFCLTTSKANLKAQYLYEKVGMKKVYENNQLVWYSKEVC